MGANWEIVKDRGARHTEVHGVAKSGWDLVTEQQQYDMYSLISYIACGNFSICV